MRRHSTKFVTVLVIITIYFVFIHGESAGNVLAKRPTKKESSQFPKHPPQTKLPSERIAGAVVSSIFKASAEVSPKFGTNNLVAQNEAVAQGPWIVDPPLTRQVTTEPFEIRFKCLWNAQDLCPSKYVVILRGPTIYSPPVTAFSQSNDDPTLVTVQIQVPDPGNYKIYAWPDFQSCPKYWRDNMKYPVNRGQVQGLPADIIVTGRSPKQESLAPCDLDHPETNSHSDGRWVAKEALQPVHQKSPWMQAFPEDQKYVYQPYSCKRPHFNMTSLNSARSIKHILFVGDSVLRGSFCSQIWPQLAPSGKADGECTFINDPDLYHVAPKTMDHVTPDGRPIKLSFRFMDDKPIDRLNQLGPQMVLPPSHIVANLGLWLAPLSIADYALTVESFLIRIHELFPKATVIWRTTTDVAPMIQCFSDKGMTRSAIAAQREVSLEIVDRLKQERNMRIFVVDAYAMTIARPDTGNDGRHWVIESPEEYGWLPKMRPDVNEAERAVIDGIWEVLQNDNRERTKEEGDQRSKSQAAKWWG